MAASAAAGPSRSAPTQIAPPSAARKLPLMYREGYRARCGRAGAAGDSGTIPAMARSGELPSIDVASALSRGSAAADLHHRHLNRQMVRVLRAIGFDRTWVGGEGAHLIDSKGDRYLDLLSGYGVFALGRNPPAVRAQLERVLEAGTASLPQL